MIPAFFNRSKIPRQPGVYIYKGTLKAPLENSSLSSSAYKDKAGKVLYVGKAIDLYHRVSSYFQAPSGGKTAKTNALVEKIAKVETIVVESELEALILEANLIKKYLPPFNVRLTDDKDYLYIIVTKDDFPKILTARKKDLKGAKEYWGPFPSSRTVKETLKSLRRVFPWCSITLNLQSRFVQSIPKKRSSIRDWKRRPCFYYHLGLCPGACIGLIDKRDYQKIIASFSKFMDGKKEELIGKLLKELAEESKRQRFEIASRIKKILDGITYITQPNRVKLYLENPNFLEEERQLALKQLKKDLNLEDKQCYSITSLLRQDCRTGFHHIGDS